MGKRLYAAIATGALSMALIPTAAQAAPGGASGAAKAPAAAKTKCKVRAKIAVIPRTGKVGGKVTIKCPKNVTKMHNRIKLYRNGKQVGNQLVHGKRTTSNLQSAKMSGTKCQKWRVESETYALDKGGIIKWYHKGSKSRTINPRPGHKCR